MKKNYVLIFAVIAIMFFGTFMVQAQQKNFINYQGVARNSENELMEQETLNISIALKFGSADAADQYKESHSVTTDANGVFNLQIGSGVSNGGSYDNLPWGDAAFVAVSFNGAEVGTTELMAVPFAIASGDNVWKANGNDIENKNVGEVKIKSDLRILGGFNLNSGNQVNEISDDGALVENSNGILPTQRAVKTYVDNRLFSGGGDAQIASEVPYDNTDSGLTADNVQDALDEFVSTSGGGSDADADPTNELQDISLLGTDLSITDGSTIDLSAIIPPGGTDDQNASEVPFDNTGTGLAAGDTQAAIEELASGGLVDTDDQNLSLTGTVLEITDGTGVDLSAIIPPGGTDDQNASEVPFDNTGTGLAAGDTQAAIEELASGGLVDTDDQNLSLTGTLLEITDGTGVDLSVIIPSGGTDDQNASEVPFDNTGTGLAAADTQAAIEELASGGLVDTDDQNLSLSGTLLEITDGTGVDLSAIIPPGGTDDQNASEVPFDNTGTGLAAADTQAAIEELASGGLVDTDDQNLSLSGTLLEITDGTGVDLSAIIPPGGTDDQNAAEVSYDNVASGLAATDAQAAIDELATSGVVDTDDQALILTGDVLTIEDGLGSIDLSAYKDAPDLTTQTGLLQGDGTTISGLVGTADNQVAKWNNATNTWAAGTDETGGLALPYYDETSLDNGAAFHTHNTATAGRYGIAGSAGIGAEILPSNSAGVLGHGAGAHGVYGVSENNFWAGVQGVSNSVNGVGVQGYAFGGGVGGHFYTTTTGVAALTTGRGNVGIGIDEPEMKMHVGGDLFVQTDLGELVMGFPENGNQWQFSTLGAGADLQFDSKPIGSNVFDTRFRMRQGGEFQVGDISSISAWAHIRNNSTIIKPNLKLEEEGNDFARLELTNNASGGAFWHVAGLPSSTAANAKLNFYFRNASGGGDRMTITGNGQVGINTSNPSARLTINQAGQEVGTGLSFRDGTANKDWHITHGFALMFHYGDELRGFINANTGAYTSASDKRLKSEIRELPDVLERVSLLKPSSYIFKADKSRTRAIGFVAQEVQPLFPELVSESGDDDILGVNYAGFSVVAIRAIQKQQEIISEQSRMISKLEERLQRLEAVITK